ncbi:MAG: glycosyltransferase family 2 protein [Agathobacter sp.]|nr:glycosyltransferase family 2 protein [Agathobacter sp.]
MQIYDFQVFTCRFHVYDNNKFIFVGAFKDDNPDNRQIKVYFDDKETEVNYVINKGVEIRQKYLGYKANISEEIIGEVTLSSDWKNKKWFRIESISVEDGAEVANEVCSIPIKTMQELQYTVQYNVDNVSVDEDKLVVFGWTVDREPIDIQLYKGNELVSCEVTKQYRRDICNAFKELPSDYYAGFKVEVKNAGNSNLKLVFKAGDRESNYTVKKNAGDTSISMTDRVLAYFKRYGLKMTVLKILNKVTSFEVFKRVKKETEYETWRAKYEVKDSELKAQRKQKFAYNPMFSIVIPLYDTKPQYLRELIESIQAQTYKNWELCLADGTGVETPLKEIVAEYMSKDSRIKYEILTENKGISENTNAAIRMATGEYIVLADHDDIVPANALFECVKVVNEDSSIDVIYSDEDKIDMSGKKYFDPHFKSDFNIDLLCSMNYICHLFVVKKDIIDKVGMLRAEFDGAQDHDFILRCCEVAQNIKHIPKILYHWRCHINSTAANPESKLYAFEAGRKAVEAHYERIGVPATVEHAEFYGMFRTKYHWEEKPLVSIIIPNKDHAKDLKTIIDSIDKKSTYRNYEFVIVENNSTEDETFAYYKELEKREDVQVLYYEGVFNYSRINNFGAASAKGEYFLLLNNDTELISPDGLETMLHICMRDDVGIVGAKLCYDDDTIQHAGVVLGFGGMAGHAFIGSSRYDVGYGNRIACTQDLSAVTAACLMVKKSVYEQVEGLTEEFQVAFNDIDFCMKVRALDKLVVYTPYAELYHYESKSRGAEDTPEKVERFNSEVARFIDRWNKKLQAGDPYYNCNLTLDKADFSLKE